MVHETFKDVEIFVCEDISLQYQHYSFGWYIYWMDHNDGEEANVICSVCRLQVEAMRARIEDTHTSYTLLLSVRTYGLIHSAITDSAVCALGGLCT
jgi:hypothetical protein